MSKPRAGFALGSGQRHPMPDVERQRIGRGHALTGNQPGQREFADRPRGRPRGGAPKSKRPLYTYGVGLPTVTAAQVTAVAIGTVQYRVNTSFQIIDFVCIATAATFLLTSFYVGDTNMWLGANPMPADMFFPTVQNRGLRFTTAKGGRDISIGWNSAVGTTTLQTLVMALKVRSYFRG